MYKERLKDIREQRNIPQKILAQKLNMSPYTYSHYENEQAIFPSKYLSSLCEILNISVDYLLGLSNKENYKNIKNEFNKKIIGERLKKTRKEKRLTQKELAALFNTTQSVIAGYESGRRLIATPFLYMYAKKYHISADYILGRIEK